MPFPGDTHEVYNRGTNGHHKAVFFVFMSYTSNNNIRINIKGRDRSVYCKECPLQQPKGITLKFGTNQDPLEPDPRAHWDYGTENSACPPLEFYFGPPSEDN